jgi:thiamine biosynthesis lipoprotein
MTSPANDPPQTLHVEHCMGTVFTIDIRDPGSWDHAISEAVAWLHQVDALFSTYKDQSQISRIRRGELAVQDAHPDVAFVLTLCAAVETETAGYFTTYPSAGLDPTGLVKGWAIEQASRVLHAHGSHNHPSTVAETSNSQAKPPAANPGRSASATPPTPSPAPRSSAPP